MSCQRCKSERIVQINAKCSDLFDMSYGDNSGYGYVPKNLFFGKGCYGDYVRFSFCAECGQIQSDFPISDENLNEAMDGLDK